jgi:hypothetical protein
MKKAFLVLFFLPFFAFRCEKDTGIHCYKGKVIRVSCASYVIQVLNNDFGEDQWKDSTANSQTVYDNVFNVSNKCAIPDSYKTGDVFYFDIENPNHRDNCVVCMMYDAPPKMTLRIKNISSTPCQ